MDWFSWLAKTSLELTLVYDYGVVFACNELTEEDIAYFDHEFLQSMGINVAKHRLEIIKLARSEAAGKWRKGGVTGRLREAIGRTKWKVVECAKKMMMFQNNKPKMDVKKKTGDQGHKVEGRGEVFMLTHNPHSGQWDDKGMSQGCKVGCRSPRMKSGPLERNGKSKVIKDVRKGHSGPLDKVKGAASGWIPERSSGGSYGCKKSPVAPLMPPMCKSPMVREVNDGIDSLWAKLFQDMKPT